MGDLTSSSMKELDEIRRMRVADDAEEDATIDAGRGCLQKAGLPAAAITFIALLVGGLVLFRSNDDNNKTSVAAKCSSLSHRQDNLQLIACGDAVAQPAASSGAGDGSSFAGHYVMVSGLDDPSGLDLHDYGGRPPMTGAGPSSATIDIGGDGKITGGSYHVSGDSGGCHYTFDGDTATGAIAPGGNGDVIFKGSQTEGGSNCRSYTFDSGRVFQFGVISDDLTLCRSNIDPSLNKCNAVYPRIAAMFKKQS